MTREEVALLTDSRLSREARIMGLYVSSLGEGEHPVSHDQFRIILGRSARGLATDSSLAGFIQELTAHGWVARKPGGRGSPRYRFAPPSGVGRTTGVENSTPLPGVGKDSTPPSGVGKEALYPPARGGQTPPSSTPPSTPPPVPDARARERPEKPSVGDEVKATVHKSDELLAGCRDSLLDYLAVRVDPRYQGAYVQRVVTSLQGADEWMWKDRTGRTLTDGRTKVLAAAFNELASGDEVGPHFPEPPGGFGNLRSKVRYLVASSLGVDRDSAKNGTTSSPTTAKRGTFPEPTRSTTDAA